MKFKGNISPGLGNLGWIPENFQWAIRAGYLLGVWPKVRQLTLPELVFTPAESSMVYSALTFRNKADPTNAEMKAATEARRYILDKLRAYRDAAPKNSPERKRRNQILDLWNPPSANLGQKFLIGAAVIASAGALSAALAPAAAAAPVAGGAAAGGAAAGGAAAGAAAGGAIGAGAAGAGAAAGAAAAGAVGVTGTLLPAITVTATGISAGAAAAAAGAALVGAGSLAASLPSGFGMGTPAMPPGMTPQNLPMLDEVAVVARTPGMNPAVVGAGVNSASAPWLSQDIFGAEFTGQQSVNPSDFGAQQAAPEFKERIIKFAKDQAIDYGTDRAMQIVGEYYAEKLQAKMTAQMEAQLRAEMEAAQREYAALLAAGKSPEAARQGALDSGKFGVAMIALAGIAALLLLRR